MLFIIINIIIITKTDVITYFKLIRKISFLIFMLILYVFRRNLMYYVECLINYVDFMEK